MTKLMNLRKNKKGFTLVEIIVVLVIMAILAAIAIPTMLGFVDEARKSGAISEARAGYTASQLIVTKETAQGTKDDTTVKDELTPENIEDYTGDGTKITAIDTTKTIVQDGRITIFVCDVTTNGKDYTVTLNMTDGTAVADAK